MIAAVCLDNWKLPIFKRRLASYTFTQHPGITDDTLTLRVQFTEDGKDELVRVIKSANQEAADQKAASHGN